MASDSSRRLLKPANPNLPLATNEYARNYQDQLNNVLRLFFNQITTVFDSLLGSRGGKYLQFPYAAIQRTTDKTFTANTATQITFDQNDFISGMTNDGTDGIVVQQAGVYNYQFSVQFANTDSQAHNAWIWLRINNTDVAGTNSKWDVPAKHGSSDGYIIAAANFYVQLNEGDYVSMYAAAASSTVYMEAYAAQASPFVAPSVPSVVATLSFVSATEA